MEKTSAILPYIVFQALFIFILLNVTSHVKNGTIMAAIKASVGFTLNIMAKAPTKVMIAIKRSSGP